MHALSLHQSSAVSSRHHNHDHRRRRAVDDGMCARRFAVSSVPPFYYLPPPPCKNVISINQVFLRVNKPTERETPYCLLWHQHLASDCESRSSTARFSGSDGSGGKLDMDSSSTRTSCYDVTMEQMQFSFCRGDHRGIWRPLLIFTIMGKNEERTGVRSINYQESSYCSINATFSKILRGKWCCTPSTRSQDVISGSFLKVLLVLYLSSSHTDASRCDIHSETGVSENRPHVLLCAARVNCNLQFVNEPATTKICGNRKCGVGVTAPSRMAPFAPIFITICPLLVIQSDCDAIGMILGASGSSQR